MKDNSNTINMTTIMKIINGKNTVWMKTRISVT